MRLTKYYDVIKNLKKLGFNISSFFRVYSWIDSVINEIENYKKEKIDFDVDWLVLKVNNIALWNDVWWTEHHPRYAVAYKFPAEIVTTRIISVDHQVWRTGTITPVANLEPVNIGWVIVKRATLHNYEEVAELWIKVGDMVFVKRAGEVIPKIIGKVE
jgi:DNA ligase (NAD+)